MRDIAIVATAQAPSRTATTLTTPELLVPVITDVMARLAPAGVERSDIGFWCHGSCDYLTGQPFSFVAAVDVLGAWPPIIESHVEADGAFALYEAWVKIQTGEVDSAVVFSNGKSTSAPADLVMALQHDPYVEAPLWPTMTATAAMQARACLDAGVVTGAAMADVAVRNRRNAMNNPLALLRGDHTRDELLSSPMIHDPLRSHDCAPITDGANAVVLAAGDLAASWCERPAWIRGIDHRIDTQRMGARDLTVSSSTMIAAERAGVGHGRFDIAELHAPFTHQELLLETALGLDPEVTSINPSGGALCANPQMAAGLARIIEVADRIHDARSDRGLAHATSGPCLQQNLVAVLEGA